MTREEAIEEIRYYCQDSEQIIEAINQSSEDCVSRQAVLERINDWWGITSTSGEPTLCDCIRELPPVTPTRKVGKWIKVTETDFGIGYKCSECGRFILTESIDEKKLKDFPYCHCGAEMESEEDGND